jgi:ABC-type sugar transport system substrate-binding protein/GAF domain-containing protein/HAMP domain-containing protein
MNLIKFFRNLKIGVKLNIVAVVVMSLLLAVMIIVVNRRAQNLILQTGQHQVEIEADVVQRRFNEAEQIILSDTKFMAASPGLIAALVDRDIVELRTIALVNGATLKLDEVDVTDANGKRILNPSTTGDSSGNLQEESLITLAKLGIEASGFVEKENGLGLVAVIPLHDEKGEFVGLLLASRDVDNEFLAQINSNRDEPHLVLVTGRGVIAHDLQREEDLDAFQAVLSDNPTLEQALNGRTAVSGEFYFAENIPHVIAYTPLIVEGDVQAAISILAGMDELAAFQSQLTATTSLIFLVLAVATAFVIALFGYRSIGAPIGNLESAARQLAAGDYSQRVVSTSNDEIGLLAVSFNYMADQLQETLERLNQRARALATSAEVSRRLSTILNRRELVFEVVEQVKQAFGYYHAHIYLLEGDELVMAGGTGDAGAAMLADGHKLPKGRGLVGRAAESNESVLVPSVERTIGFEIITSDTVEEVFERESSLANAKTWYTNHISKNFTDLQVFAKRVAQKKAAGGQIPKLGYILYGMNDFLETTKIGAEEAAQSLGLDVEIVSADFDPDQGIRLFREMIRQKKDGLIVHPLDPEKWVAPIQEAVDAGIPVLTANLRCPGSASSAWFGQDSYQSGIILGRELQQALTAAGKTSGEILVASAREIDELHERYTGLQRILQDSAYTLSEFHDASLDEQQNITVWERLIQSHPDIVAAVGLASVDLPSLIKLKKRFNAQWVAAGYDLTVEVLEAIKDGTAQVTIGQHPYMQGYLPVLALGQYYVDGISLKDWIVDGWQSNPLLPKTRAEVAIPISIGDQVLGVLDVQHDVTDGLGQEDVDVLRSIANQVAVAMQNIESAEAVAKRASELQTVAAISTATATIQEVDEMLATVVHLTQRQFGLYHAHVFSYDKNTEELQIVACGWKEGDPNEGLLHGDSPNITLDQEQSLVARAARTRQAVVANEVRSEPGWLPNPQLPDSRAELAVPLIVGDKLLGVLDVQSDRVNAFSDEDANIQLTLASQIAVALENARSFADAQKQADRETTLNTIVQKIQSTATIEEAMQIAARELGHALGKRQTLVALDAVALGADVKKVATE